MNSSRIDLISPIITGLNVGDWASSGDYRKLRAADIRAVLTIESEPKTQATLDLYAEEEIDHLQLRLDDIPEANITQFFDASYDWIHGHIIKGENVLVHCFAGVSRSVTLVLHYLIKQEYLKVKEINAYLSPEQALKNSLALVRSHRPAANPNPGFIAQLIARAKEYSSNSSQTNLKTISPNDKSSMCDKNFVDEAGKPANVICLTNEDFDDHGNLRNFKDASGVIFFWGEFCGHCRTTKPEFSKFSNSLPSSSLRSFAVDGVAQKELMARINPQLWGYNVRGYPTIVGYFKGKFFSEYAPDPTNQGAFRKSADFIEYSKGLGTATVDMV